jgi:alkylation response protein AidB-like acyl-CoA dehydrogenase
VSAGDRTQQDATLEDLDAFRVRARAWALEHLPEDGDTTLTNRELQAILFDGGFAGLAMPTAYGGAGLTLQHQRVFFDDACKSRRVPSGYMVSIGMLGPTLLDHGSEEMKHRQLPRILRGDEEWIQLLSEPSGGSDMASALTRLTRDGDHYVLNGAKMWSTGAAQADWGMCLARTDWDVPKHRGLSMIAVPLKGTEGVVIEPIKQVTGVDAHFCQEFFDNVVLPADALIGAEHDGWAVAQTLLGYERLATTGAGHGYGLEGRAAQPADDGFGSISNRAMVAAAAARAGTHGDAGLRALVAESNIERTVARHANRRIMTGMRTGHFSAQWGSLLKLHLGVDSPRQAKIALAAFGSDGVIWDGDDPINHSAGDNWLNSRGISIAGGSNEMQRNILSERVLGLPREPSFDRDVPFNEVLRNRSKFAG